MLVFVTCLPNRRQKKIPTERSGWGVLGVSLAEELKGEGRKKPAQWPDAFIRMEGLFVSVDSAVFLHAQFRMRFL